MMRGIVAAVAVLMVGWTPGPAWSAGLEGLLRGVNGVLTFVADPIVEAIEPPEDIEEVPGSSVLRHPFGFVYGSAIGIYRAASGVFDVALTPLWVVPGVSPIPRFDLIPFYELEDAPMAQPRRQLAP
jgi:hypothetical protein